MIHTSKYIKFNGKWSDEFATPIYNVKIQNVFYQQKTAGNRVLKEDKISGRDEPYFYKIDNEPLSFKVTIALQEPLTRTELGELLKWLLSPRVYKELTFSNDDSDPSVRGVTDSPFYYAVVVDQPVFHYIGRKSDSEENYIGYIDLNFRCNSNTGFTEKVTEDLTFASDSDIIDNIGDLEVAPDISVTGAAEEDIKILNTTNNSSFTYSIDAGETINYYAKTKKIVTDSEEKNPYENWGRDYLILDVGENVIEVRDESNAKITNQDVQMIYRAPKFL